MNGCGSTTTIQQGDQYGIPLEIRFGETVITPDNCSDLRVQIGDVLCSYSDGHVNNVCVQEVTVLLPVQSAYPQANCKARRTNYNGTFGAWEWDNPPMIADVEYRTTERRNGLPVYKKQGSNGIVYWSTDQTNWNAEPNKELCMQYEPGQRMTSAGWYRLAKISYFQDANVLLGVNHGYNTGSDTNLLMQITTYYNAQVGGTSATISVLHYSAHQRLLTDARVIKAGNELFVDVYFKNNIDNYLNARGVLLGNLNGVTLDVSQAGAPQPSTPTSGTIIGSGFEWLNPPMVTNEVYRTTERRNGLPVYKKQDSNGVQYWSTDQTNWNAESNVKIEIGSYVGTGAYGASNPMSFTFGFVPKVVIVAVDSISDMVFYHGNIFIQGQTKSNGFGTVDQSSSASKLNVTWSGKSISWYTTNSWGDSPPRQQLNYNGETYRYLAIG